MIETIESRKAFEKATGRRLSHDNKRVSLADVADKMSRTKQFQPGHVLDKVDLADQALCDRCKAILAARKKRQRRKA
jgi:hypothetical protein